ncbi:MAG: phosphoglycerate dehydrogenase, partial [Gemmatimonadetes bacterium]
MSIFYPEPHQKVLLLENIHPRAATAFEAAGYHVQQLAHSLSPSELIDQVSDVSILGIRSKTKITTDILDHAPQLKAIGAFCIGTDQIDLMAAMQKGVCVFNAPYSSTRSVVELTLAEMICLLRGAFDRSM